MLRVLPVLAIMLLTAPSALAGYQPPDKKNGAPERTGDAGSMVLQTPSLEGDTYHRY